MPGLFGRVDTRPDPWPCPKSSHLLLMDAVLASDHMVGDFIDRAMSELIPELRSGEDGVKMDHLDVVVL